jgi:hypothetical protein
MPFQKSSNPKRNIVRVNIKTFMTNPTTKKMSLSPSSAKPYPKTKSKETSTSTKPHTLSSNPNKEDSIMACKSKEVIFLILTLKCNLSWKYSLEGRLYLPLMNFKKTSKKNKRNKNSKLIKKNVTLNSWLLKDLKPKAKENTKKVSAESFKSKSLSKIKNNLAKKLLHARLPKRTFLDSETKSFQNWKMQVTCVHNLTLI